MGKEDQGKGGGVEGEKGQLEKSKREGLPKLKFTTTPLSVYCLNTSH